MWPRTLTAKGCAHFLAHKHACKQVVASWIHDQLFRIRNILLVLVDSYTSLVYPESPTSCESRIDLYKSTGSIGLCTCPM